MSLSRCPSNRQQARQTTISVEVGRYYADAKGNEKAAPLSEAIEIGLVNARSGIGAFGKQNVISIERKPVKGGKLAIVVVSNMKSLRLPGSIRGYANW